MLGEIKTMYLPCRHLCQTFIVASTETRTLREHYMPAMLRILLTRLLQKIKQYHASSWSLCLAVQARSSHQKDTCKQSTSKSVYMYDVY